MTERMTDAEPLADPREEGLRIVRAAEDRGLTVRLLGGVGVWVRCPSARVAPLARDYGDVDIVVLGRDTRAVESFLESLGYDADRLFNALHGAQRLNFMDPAHQRPLDVLVDRFSMCHSLDLRPRLGLEPLTIPVTDLLLTKLQVVEANAKDVGDAAAILVDHAPDEGDEPLDVRRFTGVLSSDWGFEHTVRASLGRLVTADGLGEHASVVRERAAILTQALDRAPKTLGWKARARLGERVKWYDLPEDVRH